ncbi:hypothetical protein, partial [Flavihumibacter sp. CACIAM 22H1]|uniref:hypothetical protein n=1 Tax=Flavihumibacter sp. CACIAM 22H1 TaxID=1812911 RepID=UPI0025B7B7E3
MNSDWRFTTKLVSKFNPAFKDDRGSSLREDWLGFFQIGKKFYDGELTFQSYLITEEKYCKAAILFFQFHNCNKVIVKNLEKNDSSGYNYEDRPDLICLYDAIDEGTIILVE